MARDCSGAGKCLTSRTGAAGAKGRHSRPDIHDLRRQAISRFFEMGLSIPEVSLINGHRDGTTCPQIQAASSPSVDE
jgi:hypothetical protein